MPARLVRKDYNKANRCPAWSGPGLNFTYPWERDLPACRDGSSGIYAEASGIYDAHPGYLDWDREDPRRKTVERRLRRVDWHFHQCLECGTRTLPLAFRFFDPGWWWFKTGRRIAWRIQLWKMSRD